MEWDRYKCMSKYLLTDKQKTDLKLRYKEVRDTKEKDRIKAILLRS